MKKNNKGFIAISLIYSFFLVFLITLLAVVSDYAHNRVLLSNVKNETQKYLNSLAEFNPVYLENREYTTGEEVRFGSETWNVIEDTGENVILILNRTLTLEEIISTVNSLEINDDNDEDNDNTESNDNDENNEINAFNENDEMHDNNDNTENNENNENENNIENNENDEEDLETFESNDLNQEEKVLMCMNAYHPAVCNYRDEVTFNYYAWNISVVKRIVDDWFMNNATMQKGISVGSIQNMNYTDEVYEYSSFVRIPIASEYDLIEDNDIWYLTLDSHTNGISYIRYGENIISSHDNYKSIRPVITVKKTI